MRPKYNKAANSYVVKIQASTTRQPARYEVTLAHGDLAIPHGLVEKAHNQRLYHTYMYAPGYAADIGHVRLVGTSVSLQEAIADVRRAWEALAQAG
jgi:hypothetical protein